MMATRTTLLDIAEQADPQRRPLIPEHHLPLRCVRACHNGGCCPPFSPTDCVAEHVDPLRGSVTEHIDPSGDANYKSSIDEISTSILQKLFSSFKASSWTKSNCCNPLSLPSVSKIVFILFT